MSTTEELLQRKCSGSGLENREYDRWDQLLLPSDNPYPQDLAIASPTSDDRSVGIVFSRIKATEFSLFSLI
jgi:hypothetical protein